MNINLISITLSFLSLDQISEIIFHSKINDECRSIIELNLSKIYKTSQSNIKGKINNNFYLCAICGCHLLGDYVNRIGYNNCEHCNFNLQFCTKCSFDLKRGEKKYSICKNDKKYYHSNIYFGINILS